MNTTLNLILLDLAVFCALAGAGALLGMPWLVAAFFAGNVYHVLTRESARP